MNILCFRWVQRNQRNLRTCDFRTAIPDLPLKVPIPKTQNADTTSNYSHWTTDLNYVTNAADNRKKFSRSFKLSATFRSSRKDLFFKINRNVSVFVYAYDLCHPLCHAKNKHWMIECNVGSKQKSDYFGANKFSLLDLFLVSKSTYENISKTLSKMVVEYTIAN